MEYVREVKRTPGIKDVDLCVVGGGITGTFAAIRAARLGLDVVIIEKNNFFGGICTAASINCWHSIYDFHFKEQIVSGLTEEVLSRLKRKNELLTKPNDINMFHFNCEMLKIELDEMVFDESITVLFQTFYVGVYIEDDEDTIEGIFVENKDGRGLVRAKAFIDASGDGDVCRDLHILEATDWEHIMPPSPCFKIYKNKEYTESISDLIEKYGEGYGIYNDWGWNAGIPGIPHERLLVETHITKPYRCDNAIDSSYCEYIGRQQIKNIVQLLRDKIPDDAVHISSIGGMLGIREGRQFCTEYKLKNTDVLSLDGKVSNPILNSSYPMDIHYEDKPYMVYKYLDGTQVTNMRTGKKYGFWKRYTEQKHPNFWQCPYDVITVKNYSNLLVAGKMIHCEKGAFSSLRVHVNLNQLGEAAGVAAKIALDMMSKKSTMAD